jgi:hypothetical protein
LIKKLDKLLRNSIWQIFAVIVSLIAIIITLFTFEGSFKDFFSSPVWTVLGVIFALFGILLSLSATYVARHTNKKELSYSIISNIPLINEKNLSPRITIHFDNQILANAQIVTLKIWNSGRVPIEKRDFVEPLSISFGEKAKLLDFQIIETIPKVVSDLTDIKNKDNELILYPLLLNSGDGILLKLTLTNFVNNLKVSGLITEVKEIKRKELK